MISTSVHFPVAQRPRGLGINNSGQVVGSPPLQNLTKYVFLYSGGSMADGGTLPQGDAYMTGYSQAWGINNSGQVAGWVIIRTNGHIHAFLYSGCKHDRPGHRLPPA